MEAARPKPKTKKKGTVNVAVKASYLSVLVYPFILNFFSCKKAKE